MCYIELEISEVLIDKITKDFLNIYIYIYMSFVISLYMSLKLHYLYVLRLYFIFRYVSISIVLSDCARIISSIIVLGLLLSLHLSSRVRPT
jgi:hypothetical protein